jgi:hypothetical protein
MPESSQQRKTRLIYEKAARSSALWNQSKRSHPKRISSQQKLERVKSQLIKEQENRLRERIDFYNRLSPDQTPPIHNSDCPILFTLLSWFLWHLSLCYRHSTFSCYYSSTTLGLRCTQAMMNMDLTSKSAYKILQQLESDPQLQSVEDTTILNDEQYPLSFESSHKLKRCYSVSICCNHLEMECRDRQF